MSSDKYTFTVSPIIIAVMQLKCCTHIYLAQNNSSARMRGISIHIKINVHTLMCMCQCLWWRERLVGTSKRQWSLVLPSDKAGKLLSAIKDPGLAQCYLSSWVLSFALDLRVTEERLFKKKNSLPPNLSMSLQSTRNGFIALRIIC